MIEFTAEVIEVKAKKTTSNDCEYRVVLVSENERVLELQQAIAESIVKVKIEI